MVREASKNKSCQARKYTLSKSPSSSKLSKKLSEESDKNNNQNEEFEDEFENLNASQVTSTCSINSTPTSDIWILPMKNSEDDTLFVNYSDIDGTNAPCITAAIFLHIINC